MAAASSVKSKSAPFSAMRCSHVDFGSTTRPCCTPQRRSTCAGERFDPLRDVCHDRVVEPFATGERAIGLHDDLVLLAECTRLALLQERVDLDLVDGRRLVRLGEELLEVRHEEIADADVARAPVGLDALERPPRVEALARHRPVEQVEVDVVEAEPRETGVERAERLVEALVVVPELRRDEDLGARHAALANCGAHVRLVAVDPRGVDVAITEAERREDRLARHLAAWGLPHAETDLGNGAAGAQRERRGLHVDRGHGS